MPRKKFREIDNKIDIFLSFFKAKTNGYERPKIIREIEQKFRDLFCDLKVEHGV